MTDAPTLFARYQGASTSIYWGVLIVLSVIFAYVLNLIDIPATLLLGPLIAGIIVAFNGAKLEVPWLGFGIAQGVLGCMIAKTIPHTVLGGALANWPLFTTGVLAVVAASAGLGWLLARLRVLPGTTIIWGLSPGAATAMMLMAENAGADAQLVAFMQYTRVIVVAAIASVITKLVGGSAAHATHAPTSLLPNDWLYFAERLVLAIVAPLLARRLRFRSGAFLIPLTVGILLQHQGLLTIELPRWLLAIAYAFIGWRIGLRFNRPLLVHAAPKMQAIIGSTLVLVAICGALAAGLVLIAGIDPLTAYLATSPGGADSAAIIAASIQVDTPFVMTMQMARFVVVLILGPAMARSIASRIAPDN